MQVLSTIFLNMKEIFQWLNFPSDRFERTWKDLLLRGLWAAAWIKEWEGWRTYCALLYFMFLPLTFFFCEIFFFFVHLLYVLQILYGVHIYQVAAKMCSTKSPCVLRQRCAFKDIRFHLDCESHVSTRKGSRIHHYDSLGFCLSQCLHLFFRWLT